MAAVAVLQASAGDAGGSAPQNSSSKPSSPTRKRKHDESEQPTQASPTKNGKVLRQINGTGDDLSKSLKTQHRIDEIIADPIKFVKDHRRNANETAAALAAKGIFPVNVPSASGSASTFDVGASSKTTVNGAVKTSVSTNDASASSPAPAATRQTESSPVLSSRQLEKSRALDEDLSPSKAGLKGGLNLFPFEIRLEWPSSATISTGLGNHGNTCYMNSTLQALLHTPPLVEILLNPQKLSFIIQQHAEMLAAGASSSKGKMPFSSPLARNKNSRNGLSNNTSSASFNPLTALVKLAEAALVRRQNAQQNRTIWPRQFSDNLPAFAKGLRRGRQEDAHEFLRLLLESLQGYCLDGLDIKTRNKDSVKNSTFVHRIFAGRFRSRVTCTSCRHPSDTFDTFLDISLDINRKNCSSLQQALRQFTAPDAISGPDKYKCEKCKRPVDAVKQFTVDAAPPILTIQLKRFSFTGRKITRAIEFPDKLDISSYMSTPSRPGLKKANQYSLYAVIHHHGGGPNSGHYVASVKDMRGRWHRMDDDLISKTRVELTDASAYILFYMRDVPDAASQHTQHVPAHLTGNAAASANLLKNLNSAAAQREAHVGPKRTKSESAAGDRSTDAGAPQKKAKLSNGASAAAIENELSNIRSTAGSSPSAANFFGGTEAANNKFARAKIDFTKPPARQPLAASSSPATNGVAAAQKPGNGIQLGTARPKGIPLPRKSLNDSDSEDDDDTESDGGEDLGAAISRDQLSGSGPSSDALVKGKSESDEDTTFDRDAVERVNRETEEKDEDYQPTPNVKPKAKKKQRTASNGNARPPSLGNGGPKPGLHSGMKKRPSK